MLFNDFWLLESRNADSETAGGPALLSINIFHMKFQKIWKMKTGYSKSERIEPWVSKSEGKGTKTELSNTKSEPKGAQREQKEIQKWASESQKWPKRWPKGAQSEPNSI